MYKTICIFLFAINLSLAFSQKVEKENLTQKVKLFWDKGNKKIQVVEKVKFNFGKNKKS